MFLASASAPRSLCHGCSISHRSMDAARLLSWGWLRIEPVSSLLPVKSPDASSASGLLRRRVGHYLLTCRLPAHHPSTSLLKSPLDPGANYVPGRETYILRPCDHFGPGDFSSVVFGIGNVVALIRSVTVLHQTTNALWWALLAIFAVLWGGTTGHEEANPRGGSRRLQTDSSLLASGGV